MKIGFLLILIIIPFSIFMSNFRVNAKTAKIRIFDSVLTLLYGQGVSILVPVIIIEDGDDLEYHDYPFIFSQLLLPYFRVVYPTTGQSDIRLKNYNLINDVTTYRWSQQRYYTGNGVAGGFLGEMYDCGGVLGIIFWSWILAMLMGLIEYGLYNDTICVIIFWWIISSIIWLPRSRFFEYFGQFNRIIATIIMMTMLIFLVKYNKVRNTLIPDEKL
jgi:hypothetical protein